MLYVRFCCIEYQYISRLGSVVALSDHSIRRTYVGVMLIMYVSQVTSLLTGDAAGMGEFVCHLVYPIQLCPLITCLHP